MAAPPEAAQAALDDQEEREAEQREQRRDDRRLGHAEAAHGLVEQQRQGGKVLAAEQRDDAEVAERQRRRHRQRERHRARSEEHTSELQSLMRISYAVFCLKKKKHKPEQ